VDDFALSAASRPLDLLAPEPRAHARAPASSGDR
jgi:hypothetical protein